VNSCGEDFKRLVELAEVKELLFDVFLQRGARTLPTGNEEQHCYNAGKKTILVNCSFALDIAAVFRVARSPYFGNVQGPVDSLTQNWTRESPVSYHFNVTQVAQ